MKTRVKRFACTANMAARRGFRDAVLEAAVEFYRTVEFRIPSSLTGSLDD